MIKVSVIVPVYNAEPYLSCCLDSLLRQSLPDIEIICVNDGSQDGSLHILQEYALLDPRIVVVSNANQGVSVARNCGVSHATGTYLMFVDADDWVEPDFCELPYRWAIASESDIVSFLYCRSTEPWISGIGTEWTSLESLDRPDARMMPVTEMLTRVSVTPYTKIWSRAFWEDQRLQFPEGVGMGEDQVVHWIGLLQARRVVHVDRALYHYRTNEMSATNNGGPHCLDIIEVYRRIRAFLDETGRYADCREAFLYAKLTMFRLCYLKSLSRYHEAFRRLILSDLGADEWSVIRARVLFPFHIRNFFKALNGSVGAIALEWGVSGGRIMRTHLRRFTLRISRCK